MSVSQASLNEYDSYIESLSETEFQRLKGDVYLDNAGAPLYSSSLIEAVGEKLKGSLFGNPHSTNLISRNTQNQVEESRLLILNLVNADPKEYSVIFTQNATMAAHLVSSCFPWSSSTQGRSRFFCTRSCHTSLVGMRQNAIDKGCSYVPIEDDELAELSPTNKENLTKGQTSSTYTVYSLLVYPKQSNFCGTLNPTTISKREFLERHKSSSNEKLMVLLDAASYVSTSQLLLNAKDNSNPDFVVLSMYKIFGWPTGLGTIVIKKDAIKVLQRKYFGGGTVEALSFEENWHISKKDVHGFENGTINYLDICILKNCFDTYFKIFKSIDIISNHTQNLTKELIFIFKTLKHINGENVIVIYGPNSFNKRYVHQGPIINFNILTDKKELINCRHVERLASECGIYLRAGSFCNPGLYQKHMNLDTKKLMENYSNGVNCIDDNEKVYSQIGTLRASFGTFNSSKDVRKLVEFINCFYINNKISRSVEKSLTRKSKLISINIYPIKSCFAFNIENKWNIDPLGLCYDRRCIIVRKSDMKPMTQRRYPEMALIKPQINSKLKILSLTHTKTDKKIHVKLIPNEIEFNIRINNKTVSTTMCYKPELVNTWLSRHLNTDCALLILHIEEEISSDLCQIKSQEAKNIEKEVKIPFTNESPFLLVSLQSIKELYKPIESEINMSLEEFTLVFRPNFIIDENKMKAFEEDNYKFVKIGTQVFKNIGGCTRCNMVSVNPYNQTKNSVVYQQLAKIRMFKDKILFGIHLMHLPELSQLPYCVTKNDKVFLFD